ncbi:sensor histidine kinase [Rossellomorea marisflavi]|uniref:sensor histidine kinase n=1 Tax=Rossellomorea marisflavi TaxID=189381 RepID=UPI003B587213
MMNISTGKLKGSGTSPYVWAIASILPFYFIFQSSSTMEIITGIILTIMFFISLRFAFLSSRWPVYLWTGILIAISITMTVQFNFIYFAFYIAYYNGNIRNRAAFLTLYVVHLVLTTASINYKFVLQHEVFLSQFPFILIIWISVILLPFNIFNRNKQGQLEEQLEDANKRISELVKQEERQRIARDLHDTLGQKLSLIGLKSDLARKLVEKNPEQAKSELMDVQQTARTALSEVRTLVSQMRGIRLEDEFIRIRQLLSAADIRFIPEYEEPLPNISLFLENILSMCLKEAVTNIVKHSGATECTLRVVESHDSLRFVLSDNGKGIPKDYRKSKGSGLIGIRERLDFVNGELGIEGEDGTTLTMIVPKVIKDTNREGYN